MAKSKCLAPPSGRYWVLVPLGNPGPEYAHTRHNLGRLALQQWVQGCCPNPAAVHTFRTGTLYRLKDPLLAIVPATYMNHSGQAVAEAVAAGFDPSRMILLYDDKDLPLGTGRFRMEGGDGGHNGLRSVIEHLGTDALARLRLGIGPFQRPLAEWVLGSWTEEEWAKVLALEDAFARFMSVLLEVETLDQLPGKVNAGRFWES